MYDFKVGDIVSDMNDERWKNGRVVNISPLGLAVAVSWTIPESTLRVHVVDSLKLIRRALTKSRIKSLREDV
jgi:hypothetical protein